ncbi:MAG TPA: phosphate acyltransferase PlsX [bacterium]|nr:phosphate acyltransferase PlsX [bacterium]
MKIVVDAMGGDNAPGVEVEGAVAAVKSYKDITVVLTGKKDAIEAVLASKKLTQSQRARLEVVHAGDVVTMSDSPAQAYKQKPDSSLVVGARLIKEGKADAFISAGNTGAVTVTSLLMIGRIPGVLRPGILVPFPNKNGLTSIIDAGANVDCKPVHLVQFAVMGDLYARHISGIENPRVGVLSVGEEDEKGNELSTATRELMAKTTLNFIGNVEGRDVTNGEVDVITCDGFVGNVILKHGEGVGDYLMGFMKSRIKKNPIAMLGALLLIPIFNKLKKEVDPNEYGGAPLLGVKKPVIITHGSIKSKGIKKAIKVASQFINKHINEQIESEIKKFGGAG